MSPIHLYFADGLLFAVHIIVIAINIFGWIFKRTRRIQLFTILATIFSWFVMGFWYGWGYCFLTDWEWDIKTRLGETNLPNSFIHYLVNSIIGLNLDSYSLDMLTLIVFALAILLCLSTNYRDYIKARKETASF